MGVKRDLCERSDFYLPLYQDANDTSWHVSIIDPSSIAAYYKIDERYCFYAFSCMVTDLTSPSLISTSLWTTAALSSLT